MTQLEDIWKTTSIFVRVEDDPTQNNATKIQFKVKTIINDLNFFGKWEMTSKKIMQLKTIKSNKLGLSCAKLRIRWG